VAAPQNSGRHRTSKAASRIETQLIPSGTRESGALRLVSGVIRHSNQHKIADLKPAISHPTREIDAYSAAAASEAFGFAADIMKSEMRGTISDLNREPLNTP
jgi:hypothetical protein